MRYLLDTNIVSEAARPAPHLGVLEALERNAAECAISTVSWHELLFGAERLEDGGDAGRSWLSSMRWQAFFRCSPMMPARLPGMPPSAHGWPGQARCLPSRTVRLQQRPATTN